MTDAYDPGVCTHTCHVYVVHVKIMISELFTVYLTKYILLHTYIQPNSLALCKDLRGLFFVVMCVCAWKIKNNILLHKKKNRFFDFTLYMCVDM